MDKVFHHRIARWLRTAVSGAIVFHSLLGPWTAPALAETDTMRVGVAPWSFVSPAAIADLLASANPAVSGEIALTWTAPQGNVGGTPMPNWPVAAYMIHYATFSVDSAGGDTNAWWNASNPNVTFLQGPSYVPKNPGQLEANSFSGLVPGTRYYFGIKSISQAGITSPIDGLSAAPGQQANAVATSIVNANGVPDRPNGFTMSAFGGQYTVNWHPVAMDTAGHAIQIDHYIINRYEAIGSSPTATHNLPQTATSYTDTVGGLLYYYRVFAVAIGGATSEASDYVDTSAEMNRYAIASDDIATRVVIPGALAKELNSENNGLGEDLEIKLTRRQQDEVDVTLRSYHVGVYHVIAGEEVSNFAFSQSGMQVQLGLGAVLGAGQLNTLHNTFSATSAGSIAQIVSVYWYNGSTYLRLSDPQLTSAQAISVSVRNVGVYQVRATQISTVFKLTQNSPYPRVITPNDPSQNNRVFWFFDNPSGDPVSGTIYDIRGAVVKELVVDGLSPTSNSLVWNGRDSNGAVVRSGVYLYRITAGKEKATGTVVVAR